LIIIPSLIWLVVALILGVLIFCLVRAIFICTDPDLFLQKPAISLA
jgi:hypothetical protein